MNNKILCVVSLAVGAVVGSAAAWYVTKCKYEAKIDDEIQSTKDSLERYYATKYSYDTDAPEEEPEEEPIKNSKEYEMKHSKKMVNYDEMIGDLAYKKDVASEYDLKKPVAASEYDVEEEDDDVTPINSPDVLNEVPYSIPPEDFGDYVDYEPTTLYYYADGVLADEDDNEIEDPVAMVGDDFMDHYGEYEEDCVYVRNDRYRRDYEILRSEKTFAEVQAQKYSNVANSQYLDDQD